MTTTITVNGKTTTLNVREIFSIHNYYGTSVIKLVSGEILESSVVNVNAIMNHYDWKFHGLGEFSDTMVFFGHDHYGFDEIIEAKIAGEGIDVVIFGGYVRTYFIHNAEKILEVIEKNRLRIVQNENSLMQVSGCASTIFVHSIISKVQVDGVVASMKRKMPVLNIILKDGGQICMFGYFCA